MRVFVDRRRRRFGTVSRSIVGVLLGDVADAVAIGTGILAERGETDSGRSASSLARLATNVRGRDLRLYLKRNRDRVIDQDLVVSGLARIAQSIGVDSDLYVQPIVRNYLRRV